MEHLRRVCIRLARQGAQIARTMQRSDIPRQRKADTSIVTEADTAVERALIDAIRREFPDDAIIAEESVGTARGADPARADRFWILDPIDGTRSYARDLPWYCCSVAIADRSMPLAGAAVEAGTGSVFSAAAGSGAYRDDVRVHATADPFHKDIVVAIPSKHRIPLPEPMIRWCNECVVRNYGSAALHLSMVAAGMLDAAVVLESKIWDIAAAGLAVLEAGGKVTDLQGREVFPMDIPAQAASPDAFAILAAGSNCHPHLLAALGA
jgi:myo-inositol-1(or 4)-monophosphatase